MDPAVKEGSIRLERYDFVKVLTPGGTALRICDNEYVNKLVREGYSFSNSSFIILRSLSNARRS